MFIAIFIVVMAIMLLSMIMDSPFLFGIALGVFAVLLFVLPALDIAL